MRVIKSLEAIYENGVFRPLTPVGDLPEHQIVKLTVETKTMAQRQVDEMLDLAFASYDGLTEEQIRGIESARLDQEHFFKPVE